MLDQLITLSVKNKFIVLLLTFALIGWGTYSMLNISIDAVPDITNNQVQIVTVSPSLAAQEIEQFITYPIEMEMANIQDVEEIRSISRYGLSVVTVVFKEYVDVLDARQLVGQQLQVARQEIPDGYGDPSLMPITTGLGEIYQYTLDIKPGYEGKYSATDLRTIHDWVVKRQLNGIPGIVEISSFGGYVKEYEVSVNPQLLHNYNLTLLDVNNALKNNNQNTGGSYLQKGPYAYYIRTNGLIEGVEEIKMIEVTNIKGFPITIDDIAEVGFGHPPRFGAMTKNGKGEAVGGITLMIKGENASKVIKEVKNRIAQIQQNLPEGLEINPYLDRSELVNRVIHTVRNNLLEGGLIVILILVLLLGNLRAGLIVASVIPLSMLFAFGMMKIFNVTATVMSLGAIDFGLIVDATVIIIESIILGIEGTKLKLKQNSMDQLVMNTTLKIKKSAAFGAIIIFIVYMPILALTGIEGKMFRPMAMTVSFAILGALILSFTYVPVMSSLFLSKNPKHKKTLADRIMDLLYRTYQPIFAFTLRYKLLVLSIPVILLIFSLIIFNRLGAEFLPDLDEGDLAMQMTISPGSNLAESIETSTKAEKVLLDNFPEIKAVVSKIGTAEVPTDPMAIEDADVMIILKPRSLWTSADNREELVDKMKDKLSVILGASFEFTQPIQLRFNELLTGAKSDVVIKIYGEDLEQLFQSATEASRLIEPIQGAADIRVERIEAMPQLVVNYKRDKLAQYGLQIVDVNTILRTALAGEKVGVIFEGERKFDLVVRLQQEFKNDYEKFNQFYVKTPSGHQIPLSEVASVDLIDSPVQISRDNTHRRVSIGINVRNRDVQSVVEDIQDKLDADLRLPTGYYITYGGKFENLQSALSRLKIVVPIALLLIFILLYFAFRKVKLAILIFITIPLSIIGGVVALWIRGLPFSISAGIGFIALFGVAVLDGIVLINYLNDLKTDGIKNLHKRLLLATKNRLRPVTITSAVASLGFLPMALSTTSGAEVQRPLATVVIGGVITSTFLTMIIVPLVYYYFEKGINMKKKPKPVLIFLLGLLLPFFTFGNPQQDTTFVNLEQAVEISIANHPAIKNAELFVKKSNLQKKASINPGTTDVNYQRGEINSNAIDYQWTIQQNFGNPIEKFRKSEYFRTQELLNQEQKKVIQQEIIFEINKTYLEWQFTFHILQLYDSLLSEYKHSLKIANSQFEVGEINLVEKLAIEQKLMDLQRSKNQMDAELLTLANNFNEFLYSDTFYIPVASPIDTKLIAPSLQVLLSNVFQAPAIVAAEKRIMVAEKMIHLSKAAYFPEIYAGYFNQQIDELKGFEGWQAGISFPLWFFSKRKEVQETRVDKEIQFNNYSVLVKKTTTALKNQISSLEQLGRNISLMEETHIKHADKLKNQALVQYKQGEINYLEYLFAQETSMQTYISYYQTLLNYKITWVYINYLTGDL